jgi:hypothetical protein
LTANKGGFIFLSCLLYNVSMSEKPKTKLYCYVDESGQDPQSEVFIVAVIVTGEEREKLLDLCEQLERVSGKQKDKWGKAKHDRRMRYLRHIFADDRFREVLRYSVFRQTPDYDTATIDAIAAAVRWSKPGRNYTSLIYVDALSKTKRQEYGVRLRRLGLRVRQIRGIARDESNALTRLADAVAGFVRDALEGKSEEITSLFRRAKREGVLIEIKAKKTTH